MLKSLRNTTSHANSEVGLKALYRPRSISLDFSHFDPFKKLISQIDP